MTKNYRVAVVGASGLVGREILKILAERGFPTEEVVAFASENSAGKSIEFANRDLTVQLLSPDKVQGFDIVLMSAGGKLSAEYAPKFASTGAVVIDNSAYWRQDPEVPLVVPEVNAKDIALFEKRRIIANPNCSTIQMVVALSPLHEVATLKRVVVATYQAVSGKGKHAVDEMCQQVTALFNQKEIVTKTFKKRIAFNCIPHIDVFQDNGFTREEHKMLVETRKILHLPDLGVCATCVRVPVFNGHAEAVVAEFVKELSPAKACEVLKQAPGMIVLDEPEKDIYPTQIDVEGSDATFVGRIRKDESAPHALAFWCVSDNLRKGAATNAVQIAEILIRDYY